MVNLMRFRTNFEPESTSGVDLLSLLTIVTTKIGFKAKTSSMLKLIVIFANYYLNYPKGHLIFASANIMTFGMQRAGED